MKHKFTHNITVAVFVMWPCFVTAQVPKKNTAGMENEHQHEMPRVQKSLSEQIGDLSRQVSELQGKISQQGVDSAAMKVNGDQYRSKLSMGMSNPAPQAMPLNVQSGAVVQAPQVDMMAGMMSMMNSMMGGMGGGAPMGQAASLGPSSSLSVLPGFPGASHLYHIGSTNFFLDHPQHITLSLEQRSRLAEIQTKAILRRSDFNRKIQEIEEQVWFLTASDLPNFANIEAKIRESEKLRGDSRLAFIKDVGEAANVLTDTQRMALLGEVTPSGNSMPPMRGDQTNDAMGDM